MLTRLAPSPSGDLHIGHARAFLAAWALARNQGGTVRLRIEDLDGPRVVPGAAERQMEDLRWLGLDWDGEVLYQSERSVYYDDILARLIKQGHISACYQSRQDVTRAATAPHGPEGVPPYPLALRPEHPLLLADLAHHPEAALRFRVPEGQVHFEDLFQGPQQQIVLAEVGDFVLRRRDGLYAYQLAVVADDIAQGITHIVRGADLLFSTARQIQLWQALGAEPPLFGHVGLVLNTAGEKLSKRDGAVSLRALREQNTSPESLVGLLAASLGIGNGSPCTAAEVAARFVVAPRAGEEYVFPG